MSSTATITLTEDPPGHLTIHVTGPPPGCLVTDTARLMAQYVMGTCEDLDIPTYRRPSLPSSLPGPSIPLTQDGIPITPDDARILDIAQQRDDSRALGPPSS